MNVTFTLDLEDHRVDRREQGRYEAVVRNLLPKLHRRGIRGTFFVVGTVARRAPTLIRDIARAGHEIGYHGHDHIPLDRSNPRTLRNETACDKDFLESLIGAPVWGYRAPIFSLTRETLWAVDIVQGLGFAYSSSVLPCRNPLYGFPGAPTRPFVWSCGLPELPAPVGRIGKLTLPFLGGVYLRYLPAAWQRRWLADNGPLTWLYCHPFDFDSDEPFARMRGDGYLASLLLWCNRRRTLSKIDAVIADGFAPPLFERIDAGIAELPRTWAPALECAG